MERQADSSESPADRARSVAGSDERRRRYRRGILAEWRALAMLAMKGYRPLARRTRTASGEIDLIVIRGQLVAFVEVKQRATPEAAEASISPQQRRRIRRAADLWLARRSRYQDCELRFDLVLVIGWRWPVHLPGAL